MPQRSETYAFQDFVLDVDRGTLTRNGDDVPLRPKAYAVLQCLVENWGSLVSREELTSAVWGHLYVTDNSLSQCLGDVRHALDDQEQKLIHTIPGRGYRFEPQADDLQANEQAAPIRSAPFPFLRPGLIMIAVLALALLGYLLISSNSMPGNSFEENPAAAEPNSIAVLPLVDLSPEGKFAYFADGLTDDLLTLLAGVDGLKVAARTSTFYFKDKLDEVSLREIAKQLQVSHVLEGSVRKDGDRIRITAQLILADDGFHLWSNTWDRTLDDIFAIQDEIAAAVTEELKIALLGEVPTARTINPESYDLALQGRYLFDRRAENDLQLALERFERAVELDPENAVAWIGLAPLYLWLFDPPRVEEALNATSRAIDLEPENPEAWSRRSSALAFAGESEASNEAWAHAVSLGDENPLIQSQVAGERAIQGDLEGAIRAWENAVALDPLYLVALGNLANYLVFAGRLDEAQSHAEKILTLAPSSQIGHEITITIYLLKGQVTEALKSREYITFKSTDISPGRRTHDWWSAMIEHALGNEAEANAARERFIYEFGDSEPWSVAYLYAWHDEADSAFEWMNRAFELDPDLSIQYSWEPWLDSLKKDPRWDELMKRWTGTEFASDI